MYTDMVLTLHNIARNSNAQPRSLVEKARVDQDERTPHSLNTLSTLRDIEKCPLKRMFSKKQKTKAIFTFKNMNLYLQL